MFRTSNKRGQKRFNDLFSSDYEKKGKLSLTQQQVSKIEEAQILSLGEKIELLLVSLGNKLTTELYMNVRYEWSGEEQKEIPDTRDLQSLEKILKDLPFVYFKDQLPLKNRQNGNTQNFIWFQVSVNEAVSVFMKKYPDDLTEFEEGVLYGFPLSAIRAYSGLITPSHDKPTPASYFLAGVCSKDFWEDEQEYYQKWWERLRELSPKIIKEAEDQFKREN